MTHIHPLVFLDFHLRAPLAEIENEEFLKPVFTLNGRVEGNTALSSQYLSTNTKIFHILSHKTHLKEQK